MANKYYAPGAQWAARVDDLFATIAPRYDLINDLQSFGLHRVWKRRLVRLASVRKGVRALDLCCGTGDIARALAQQGASVVGLDFSAAMLRVAQTRHSSTVVQWMRGDALQIPFSDGAFDLVTIGYGLRNLSDCRAAVAEMLRVLRPGGRLLVLDFGKPDNALWRALYFAYLRWIVPLFRHLFCRDAEAYRYILESLLHYPAQRGVAALMREKNCQDVRIINLLGGVMSINYGEKKTASGTRAEVISKQT